MSSGSTNNEKALEVRTHDIPIAEAMTDFMMQGWAPSPLTGITAHPSIPYTKIRREKLSKFSYFKLRINERPKPR
jgi:Xaa-Pro aminopeptidase